MNDKINLCDNVQQALYQASDYNEFQNELADNSLKIGASAPALISSGVLTAGVPKDRQDHTNIVYQSLNVLSAPFAAGGGLVLLTLGGIVKLDAARNRLAIDGSQQVQNFVCSEK
jgi:hypothetical protein